MAGSHSSSARIKVVLRVTAAVAGKALRRFWRRLPSETKAQLRTSVRWLVWYRQKICFLGRARESTSARLDCSVESAWLGPIRAMPAMCLSVQVIFCSFGFPTQFVGILALCYYWWKSTFFWPTQVFIQWRVEKGSLLSAQIKSRRSAGAQLSHFFDSLSLFFNLRTAFEGLLEELGPSIVPASDNLYQRFQHLIMFHVKIMNYKL